jgi:hypothetical protein
MKRFLNLFTLVALALFTGLFFDSSVAVAQEEQEHGRHFVDENGDGYNDNAPDTDGDGIPNGQDEDYERTADGTGNAKGFGGRSGMRGFVDEDGDGINDLAQDNDGDGIPNGQDEDYVRPESGSGQAKGFGRRSGMRGFIDEDGDGINDNAPDADGDGIPNGQDEDYVKPADGQQKGNGFMGRGAKGMGNKNPVQNGSRGNGGRPDNTGNGNCSNPE